jgi:hypothetical protein
MLCSKLLAEALGSPVVEKENEAKELVVFFKTSTILNRQVLESIPYSFVTKRSQLML